MAHFHHGFSFTLSYVLRVALGMEIVTFIHVEHQQAARIQVCSTTVETRFDLSIVEQTI